MEADSIIRYLIENKEAILMDYQHSCCSEPRLVYRSPVCYTLGLMLESFIKENQ